MKSYIFIITILSFSFGCNDHKNEKKMVPDRPNTSLSGVSEYAQKLNLGFEDEPVFVWCEIIGNLAVNQVVYDHILGVKYTYIGQGMIDTIYYESFGRNNLKFKQPEVSLSLYPGNTTIKAFSKAGDELVLHEVFEIEDEDKKWVRVPTATKNLRSEYVASDVIELQIGELTNNQLQVKFRDDKGIRDIAYKWDKKIDLKDKKISFLDRLNGKIYFLEKMEFIEPLNFSELAKL